MEPVYELPVVSLPNVPQRRYSGNTFDSVGGSDHMFGGLSNAGNSRRYQVIRRKESCTVEYMYCMRIVYIYVSPISRTLIFVTVLF